MDSNIEEEDLDRVEAKYVDVLPKEVLDEMKDCFVQFDKDEDGFIDRSEVRKVWKKLGYSPTEAELEDVTQYMDPNNSGKISFFHFKKTFADFNIKYDFTEEELRHAYRVFDKEGLGYITIKELRRVTQLLGDKFTEKELTDMVKEIDLDGDGRIAYYEYIEFLKKKDNVHKNV